MSSAMTRPRAAPGTPPLQVGLTGNAASGKSTVARVWEAAGVPVVSADALAREVVAPGTEGLAAVVEAFGPGVLDADGVLDRAALRAIVLQDPAARRRLEGITHPRIADLRAARLHDLAEAGHRLVVSEIPLLFEAGLENTVDRVVLVEAPASLRLARLVEDRGLAPPEARALLAAQQDPATKRAGAHHHLPNEEDLATLETRALALLERLRDEAGTDEAPPAPGRLRLDLHLHTWGSWDSLSDPEAVLARARARGVGRIAITDHNRLHVALAMATRYPDAVIPGEEVKTAEGIDVIGLYLREEIPKGTSMAETCRQVRAQGGIVYLPHPYAPGKGGSGRHAETLAAEADVVEVWNARLLARGANDRGAALAARFERRRGAGSDAHTPAEAGNAWVEVPDHPNTPEALLEALAAPGLRVYGERAPVSVFLRSNLAKLRKKLGWRRPNPGAAAGYPSP